jgi:hypothetical protein
VSLNLDHLEKPHVRAGKLIARCPVCAETGADRAGEHLVVADEGRGPFGCVLFPGPAGEAHRRRIWELVGNCGSGPRAAFPAPPTLQSVPAKGKPRIPALCPLNVTEMAAVANLRGWPSFAGLELLGQRALLWHGMVWDGGAEWPAWIITDSTRRNAQARRLDGELWRGIGNKKAKTLPGSDPSWPIGATEIGNRPFVALCEGGPDFLAALLVAWFEGTPALIEAIAPICITGAGNSIHSDALPFFAGKRIRIAVHADNAGREAGESWAQQLYGAGAAHVDGFDFTGIIKRDGQPVKDLGDYATLLDPENPPTDRVLAGLEA